MSVKKKYEVVQPPLSAYPLNRASGKVELLDAFTIYKWDGHYWFAVLKLRSTFGDPPRSKISIRGYRWQWKRPYSRRGEAEQPERWVRECHLIFNKKSQWEEFKKAADEMFEEMPDE